MRLDLVQVRHPGCVRLTVAEPVVGEGIELERPADLLGNFAQPLFFAHQGRIDEFQRVGEVVVAGDRLKSRAQLGLGEPVFLAEDAHRVADRRGEYSAEVRPHIFRGVIVGRHKGPCHLAFEREIRDLPVILFNHEFPGRGCTDLHG